MTSVEICRWKDPAPGAHDHEQARRLADIDRIFFSSSAVQSFANPDSKNAFRERWLGRYLCHFPQHVFLAVTPEGDTVGYVIGSLDDPARDPLFSDIPILSAFGALTTLYPAQLHVNLDEAWRGKGLGARLVDAFAAEARAAGAPGVHVITQRGMRNVGFYVSNNFVERGVMTVDGRDLLFLGRDLTA